MGNYFVLRPNQTPDLIAADGPMPYDQIHQILGGYMQALYTGVGEGHRQITLIVNDDGLRLRLPPSVRVEPWGLLVGPVIIGSTDVDEFMPLSPAEQERIALAAPPQPNVIPTLLIG